MPAVTIANGVDLETFHPSRRDAGRALLGVDPSTAVLLFGAGTAAERRKGLPQLASALERLSAARAQLGLASVSWKVVVVGNPAGVAMPEDAVVLGHISDRERLASIVAAADLALLPSLEDNLPNFVAEALACGTPCVAFAAGGVPEMLGGLPGCALAEVGDPESLAQRIAERLRELDATRAARGALRAVAEERYSQVENARRYLALYESRCLVASAARTPARMHGGWSQLRTGLDLRTASLFLRILRHEIGAAKSPRR
jgi:glycosyltransferase involved in cell wall biosynthesis